MGRRGPPSGTAGRVAGTVGKPLGDGRGRSPTLRPPRRVRRVPTRAPQGFAGGPQAAGGATAGGSGSPWGPLGETWISPSARRYHRPGRRRRAGNHHRPRRHRDHQRRRTERLTGTPPLPPRTASGSRPEDGSIAVLPLGTHGRAIHDGRGRKGRREPRGKARGGRWQVSNRRWRSRPPSPRGRSRWQRVGTSPRSPPWSGGWPGPGCAIPTWSRTSSRRRWPS
jgi:hypothetical protein